MAFSKEFRTSVTHTLSTLFPRVTEELALKFLPNPREQNTAVVENSLQSILADAQTTKPEAYFRGKRTVPLTFRTGVVRDVELLYETVRDEETARAFLMLSLGTQPLGRRNWFIFKGEESFHAIEMGKKIRRTIDTDEYLCISSSLHVTPKWEGNGLATTLLKQSDAICVDLSTRYLLAQSDLPVLGRISDAAHGRKLNRFRWTSDMMQEIDYMEFEHKEFVKRYR